jgi:phosphinothricin acetyltransferase
MQDTSIIRLLNTSDYIEVHKIFSHYVSNSYVTPESNIPDFSGFERKLKNIIEYYPFLVCEQDGQIVGYTYATKYRVTSGNQWSVETAIYIAENFHGKGYAKTLYENLFPILTLQNFVNVFAGIVLPNDKSVSFHKKMNFKEAGVFKNGIYKFDRWHDVQWMQLKLREHVQNPASTRSVHDVIIH